ncbi:uncharacterized protein LOC116256830 isoform X2 [Nymphaea colorata]|uniref:uncharacterized protein LOC116256830 isoform X2 n=1 Tax=Nymphaea colorata TaxID=210225 RepID=UPI00214E757A|nr:uncharacterized protein LOC116256830 isoform X2 [Nymphaea colorata]XP_049934512.1 uncharacterized protein LOC116256830 isoform X2 [Nymphaea colorata]
MPGTILVTVLELMEVQLPSASTSSSPGEANTVLVKVSHGKREYRTEPHYAEGNRRGIVWESSDFSFPVFSLRDNLTISVLDCDENEIGRADIRSHSIIEKGLWDDMFPLKGGGSVHLKLQFVLSDAEQQRIRAMEPAALKKKEEGTLKESLPEVCVEKVPSVDHETFSLAPGVISSPQNFVLESPSLPSDQSSSSTTPPLSSDVKNCEDNVAGYLSKHEEPYRVASEMDKPQSSKPEVTPKGKLRKVKEMIQAFESTTSTEKKRAKLSRLETKFHMAEADSHAQYSWKVESRIKESSMIQKDSGALHKVDVPKHYTTDKHSNFGTETGNEETKFHMAQALRNGRDTHCFQDFVEMEDGRKKSNQEPSEKEHAKLTKTFSFIEASSVLQNPLKKESSFTRSKSASEFKSSKVDVHVNVTGGYSPEKLLPFDVLLQEKVPLRSTSTHDAETEGSNQEPLPAKILEIGSLICGKPQLTINESRSYKGDTLLQSTNLCDAKSVGAKVVLRNGEDVPQFTVDDETGQVAHLGLCSHQCINNGQMVESVGSLPFYWFPNKYQESLAMHPQVEHRVSESLTDYITCGEMRYLCLTAGNEQVKNLAEIYRTSENCTLQKKSDGTQAANKGFIENIKDSSCQKKTCPDNLMGALYLLDGFLKQV